MTSSRTWLPVAAVAFTVLLVWLARHGTGSWALTGGLLLPLLVPAVWAAVGLLPVAPQRLLPRAGLGAGLGLMAAGWPAGLAVLGYVAAGLVVGVAWRWRWRALTVLALGAACLVPGFFLGLDGASVPATFEAWGEELREQHAAGLPDDLPAGEREAALTALDERLAGTLALQRRLWPSLVAAGLLGQSALVLALGWLVAQLLGARPPGLVAGSFLAWRAPFATVWCLIGGLALSLAPLAGQDGAGRAWNDIGWNLVLGAALLLAVQGLAVQAWLVRRLLPPFGRIAFWVLGALFFAPVIVGSGALVGLADQWWNLRRLRRPSGTDPDRN